MVNHSDLKVGSVLIDHNPIMPSVSETRLVITSISSNSFDAESKPSKIYYSVPIRHYGHFSLTQVQPGQIWRAYLTGSDFTIDSLAYSLDFTLDYVYLWHGKLNDGRELYHTESDLLKEFELVSRPKPDSSMFPHTCKKCGAPAYNGLFEIQCSAIVCHDYKAPKDVKDQNPENKKLLP